MFELMNRFWVALPLSYAITVGGLVSGYGRGGVPSEARLPRAPLAGLPVLLALVVAWACISEIVEAGVQAPPHPGLHTVLFFVFTLSASALVGSVLASRKPGTVVERGTVVLDDAPPETSTDAGALTLAGHPVPLVAGK